MKVQGACHCGQITYEAEIDLEKVYVCNCTDCQTLTGSAFRVVVPADGATFRMTGKPKIYIKTAESGNKRRQTFCPNCGAPIYSAPDSDNPATYSLRVGGLKQRAQLRPTKRIWCRSALEWAQDLSGVPGQERQ